MQRKNTGSTATSNEVMINKQSAATGVASKKRLFNTQPDEPPTKLPYHNRKIAALAKFPPASNIATTHQPEPDTDEARRITLANYMST